MSESKPEEKSPKGFFARNKCLVFGLTALLVLTGAILVVVFLVVLPHRSSTGPRLPVLTTEGLVTKPDLSRMPSNLGSFNDDTLANSYSVKLSEEFPLGEKKIRGVNLGGWLVPEPFIVPSLYKPYVESHNITDEWGLCEAAGKVRCTQLLTRHYESWVTEDEIKELADAGINHVRIPIGYWAIDVSDDEPFVYGAWEYLLRGIQWCRKYGLRVMIDFHAAPGSQNGWNHSGRFGQIRFLNQTNPDSAANVERFLDILEDAVRFFSEPEWRNVVTQIGVLNEPALMITQNQRGALDFYKTAYSRINKINSKVLAVFHDGFLNPVNWEGKIPKEKYPNAILDVHNYIIFDNNLIVKSKDEINNFPCTSWVNQMSQSTKKFGNTMCGEFSVASNDCGPWLNGINLGARYDGTFATDRPTCPNCTCKGVDDYTKFDKTYKEFLLRFAEKQMDAFERGIGWFFWNFKTEDAINPHWDYLLGLKHGWIPKDAGKRTHSCPSNYPLN
ncbi:hypothetical protein DSO57_1007367 [Entomophthora muscae]|uniref:Uncharacterized protein n=1 Tax=Entomophthora muscae TaxID=34485 RepID=A0ACC2RYI3_9FUNG|nr:hypothetical protein DSO57_1007367 [Entomophthora muscae]